MLLPLFLLTMAQAAPKPDTYILGTDHELTISKASDQELHFELNGQNSYSGHTSSLDGVATRKGALWEFRDADDKTCVVQLKPAGAKALEVNMKDCHQDWLSEGVYKLQDKDCGSGFDKRNNEVGALSRAKKYAEALKKADALAKDCLETLLENTQGELHSDLAFLAFKTGDGKRCRDEVEKGIQAIGANHGLKELKESFSYYADEDGGCKNATQGGCWIYQDRIKVFKRLDHNGKLCKK